MADGEPKAVPCIHGQSVIVKATEGNMLYIQEANALLLWGHGADTGNTTQDTLLQQRESIAVQGYCPHDKYVPQRVRPTAKPGQARRIHGKYALREASGIKEKAGDIRCEGWKYGSNKSNGVVDGIQEREL